MSKKKIAFRFSSENRDQIISSLRFSDAALLSSLDSLLSMAEESEKTLTPLSISTKELKDHHSRLKVLYLEACQKYEEITGEPFNISLSSLRSLRERYKNHEHPHCKEFIAVFDYTDRYYNRNLLIRNVERHSYFYALVRHLSRLHRRMTVYNKNPEFMDNYSPLTFVSNYRNVPFIRNSYVREGEQFYAEAVRLLSDFPATSKSSVQVRFNPSGSILWVLSHFKTFPFLSEVGKYMQTNNFTPERRVGVRLGKEVFGSLISGSLSEYTVAEAEKCFGRSFSDFSLQMFLDTLMDSNKHVDGSVFTSFIANCRLQNTHTSYLRLLETAINSVVMSLRIIYDTYNLSGTNLGKLLQTSTNNFEHLTLSEDDLKEALQGVDIDVSSSSFEQIDMHLSFKSAILLCGEISKLNVLGKPLKFTHLNSLFSPHFHLSPWVLNDFSKEQICGDVHDLYSDLLNNPAIPEEQRLFFSFYLPEVVFPGETSVVTQHHRELDLKRIRMRYKSSTAVNSYLKR